MSDESRNYQSKRRTFLKSIGALGASAAIQPVASAQESDNSPETYREKLRAELTDGNRQQKQLPEGSYVYESENEALEAFSLHGGGAETEISVDTNAVPITKGERLGIPKASEDPSAYAYRGELTNQSLSEGDLLLAVAYVRSDSDEAEAKAAFRYTDPAGDAAPSENFVQRGAQIGPCDKWMRYFFPIEVGPKPDGTNHVPALEFWTGYADQTIEFGGVALFDYSDTDVSLGTLPPYDYEGRAEDAAWREDAQERIEEVRKTDIEVRVVGAGKPADVAMVDVEMVEHEFDFGSAVSVNHIVGDSEDDEIYRQKVRENFNKATIENGLKYPSWEGDWGSSDNSPAFEALGWLNENDIPARGHYLLWEQFNTAGGGGMSIENWEELTTDELEAKITEKIESHADELDAHVTEWDMHNHPIWQSNFRDMDGLGWDAVEKWWKAAKRATNDELYTNEMGAVGGTWQQDAYYDYIGHLVENNYHIDGIGFMGHHQQQWNQMLDVDTLLSSFDRFSGFDLPLLITEFDIQIFDRRNAQDVEVQKDYLRDFLTAAFSKEAVEGVISWGFWEDDHWRPTGAYFNSDWSLRPHGEKLQELVFEEWWTDETGETNEDGVYETRGFKGDYRITAEKGDLSGETTVTIDDETDVVTVNLTPPSESGNGKAQS